MRRLNLGKLAVLLHVVFGVHLLHVLLRRRTQHLDNLNQLVDLRISQKRRIPIDHLHQNTPHRPHINLGIVIRRPKYQLRRPVTPGTYIGKVGLI